MKVLLLQCKPFLPVLDGGNEASRALTADLLTDGYQVDCLTFSSNKHPFHPELFLKTPWNSLKIDHVPISLKTTPIPALKALLNGKSYNLSRFSSPLWDEKLKEKARKEKYDLIVMDSLFSANEIEKIKGWFPSSQYFLRAHNVEAALWAEQAENESSIFKKLYLTILAKQLKKREKEILLQVDLILPISTPDQIAIENIVSTKTHLLPYFPEVQEQIPIKSNGNFFFIGSMNWRPNIEAHELLAEVILPEIHKTLPNTTLTFAGSSQNEITHNNQKQIQYAGFVEDKSSFMRHSGILLAPIQSGSGVRIKLLEALSLGIPIITTKKGAEGIPFENKNGWLIAENHKEFVEMAIQLSENVSLRNEFSLRGPKNIQELKSKYDLKSIFEQYVG
jgi:glycosyltransferase involved in cell wall biosynthesis